MNICDSFDRFSIESKSSIGYIERMRIHDKSLHEASKYNKKSGKSSFHEK